MCAPDRKLYVNPTTRGVIESYDYQKAPKGFIEVTGIASFEQALPRTAGKNLPALAREFRASGLQALQRTHRPTARHMPKPPLRYADIPEKA